MREAIQIDEIYKYKSQNLLKNTTDIAFQTLISMNPPKNLFDDMQDFISGASYRARTTVYNSYYNVTKDWKNPLISAETVVANNYTKGLQHINPEEKDNLVPAFWFFTASTLVGSKLLPRFKFIGFLSLVGVIGTAYFPKSVESALKNLQQQFKK
eukprot:NODE_288_length_10680_cov_0.431245.p9 type:complete len:155 gc:universal NODE_288_length_10680_cov_0.431245:216-680(+)